MPPITYTNRDGKLRLYDGAATPYYIEIPFVSADFTGPIGRPRPVQTAVLNRGRLDGFSHYVEGPDDPLLQPVTISFSFRLSNTEPNLTKWRDAMNLMQQAVWTVGGVTWTTTKGRTQILSGGANPILVTTPSFTNSPRRRCVNVQIMHIDPTAGGGDFGYQYSEVEFTPDKQSLRPQDDMVSVQINGDVYGDIRNIVAFSAGTASP